MEDESAALVLLSIVEEARAYDHIGIAVPIHVPGGGYPPSKARIDLIDLERLSRNQPQPRCGAVVDDRPSLGALAVGESPSADHDVREAIAVHIARRGHRRAELGRGLLALDRGGCVGEP